MERKLLFGSLENSRKKEKISLKKLLLATFLMMSSVGVWGQVSITTGGTTYTQNFNNLSGTATPSANVTGGSFNNVNAALNGWYFLEEGSGADVKYTASNGNVNNGDTYSLGSISNSERALGGLRSGPVTPTFGFYFTNNTGSVINSVLISYIGEQWRLGTAGRNDRLDFQYSTNATSLSTGSWTDFDALDFIAPISSGTVGNLDGNLPVNKVSISSTITGLSIANGSKIFIRWNDIDATGSDDALGVDDFSLTLTNAASTATTYTWNGSVGTSWNNANNWTPNGIPTAIDNVVVTGTAVSNKLSVNSDRTVTNFELAGTNTNSFNVTNGTTLTIAGNITYSGTASALLDCNSTVRISSALTQMIPPLQYGNLNALGGNRIFSPTGVIRICSAFSVNTALYTYTVTGSTVDYFSSGTGWTMAPFTYNNLIISGTSNFTLNSGVINVNGNFLQSNGTIYLGDNNNNAKLNIIGNMEISGGILNSYYANSAEITVGGNFSQSSGEFYQGGYISTLSILGNMSLSGNSFFDMKYFDDTIGQVNLTGDLSVTANAYLGATSTTTNNTEFNFIGIGNGVSPATTQNVTIAGSSATKNENIRLIVNSGAYVQLASNNLALGNRSRFIVQSGGVLDFGFNGTTALNVTSPGTNTTFAAQNGSTLKITSSQGIVAEGIVSGNAQAEARNYNNNATYHYIGKANQVTGSGLPEAATAKKVIVELDTDLLELSASATTSFNASGTLEIRRGTVLDNGSDFFDGVGNLTMTGGLYKFNDFVPTSGTTFYPRLSGNYNVTGGTIELAAITNTSAKFQILRGSKTYHNLKISGASSNGGYKGVSNAIVVNNSLNITGTSIFDTDSKSVTGNAGVAMDGGRWRISKLTNAQPELSGSYALVGGTMEYYGTTANNNQTIKGGIIYYNIDVNAAAANTNYTNVDNFYNVSPASSIEIKGNLNTYSPAVFKIGSTYNISGEGNIFINPGSTLLYGSAQGIKTSGTIPADGAIRNSGTRNFSTDASYGFIGGQSNMITGNGIPAQVENLFIAKTANSDNITLSNPALAVKNKMVFISGNIITGTNSFQLGTDATNKGTLEHTSGFIKGKMTRWFNGTNSGNNSSLFPLGTIDNKNRFAKIEFASTSAGTLTASMNSTAMGISGVSAISAIPAAGTCTSFSVVSTDEFYWNMIPSGISGNYSASFTKESISTDLICEMTLLKRDATDWIASGTHIEPTGTSSMVTLSRSGLTGFQDFGFGNKRCGATNTWNGTAWSGGTPTASQKIIFAGNYNSTTDGGNINSCECEIQSGAVVTIASSGTAPHFLDIQNGLNNNGQLILQNNNSLMQHDDLAINTGTGTFKMVRKTQEVFRYDYTYWSSPVENQDLHSLSPNTFFDKYFSWNATASPQVWAVHNRATPAAPTSPSVAMTPGKGFIIRSPQSFNIEGPSATPGIFTAEFIGKPNNGIVSAPIVGGTDKWNLIGNPYPSAINANLFLSDDANEDVVEGTIYLWTHNTPIAATPGGEMAFSYSPADYAVYNFSGATSTAPAASGSGTGNNNAAPNGFVAAGQSFFIKGTGGGTAVFKNAMRVTDNNNQFFRIAQQNNQQNNEQTELEKHRVWLNISNASGAFSQTLVGYIENATNGYDRGFDGEVLGGNNISLYSISSQKNLSIQGRALPFNQEDQVEMGYKAVIAGNFKIEIDHFDSSFSNQNIYLEDKTLNIIHDLKQSDYEFTTQIGTFNTRFVIRYTNEALGNDEFTMNPNDVIVFSKDKNIKVISAKENIDSIMIFDLLGRMIYENKNVNAMHFLLSEITANQQALIVKVQLENGAKTDKKIIYN